MLLPIIAPEKDLGPRYKFNCPPLTRLCENASAKRAWSELGTTVAATTVVWITVTLLTRPADRSKLIEFYRLVQPAGPGWRQIRAEAGATGSPDRLTESLLGWTLGCAFVYAALFGTGSFLYGKTAQGLFWSLVFVVSLFGLSRVLPRIWSSSHG